MVKKGIFQNSIFAIVQKISEILLSFIFRTVLIKTLGVTYLGLSGIFTNIFSVLSLMELGIGSSIVFLMYKPLNDKDEDALRGLLNVYSKFYNIVAILITIIGLALMPFLPNIIKDYQDIPVNLNVIYILTLANVVFSYFLAYRRSLLEADQKAYVNSINYSTFNLISTILRILALLIFKNYILTLIIILITTIFSNIVIYVKTNRIYPFLKIKKTVRLTKQKINEIIVRMGASAMHQIGNIIITSTDNVIIAAFIGINQVGLYSNYAMITTTIYSMFSLVFCSITANIGNMKLQETNEKSKDIFDKMFFVNFYMYFVACTCFCPLVNNLIKIWIGKEYIFDMSLVIIITLNLYITGMRNAIVSFINSSGLNYNTRYKAIVEGILNLIISIVLVKYLGTLGVILGTVISFLLVSVWFEPYILFKEWFKKGLLKYYIKYGLHLLLASLTTFSLVKLLNIFTTCNNIFELIIQAVVAIIYIHMIFVLIFFKSSEFKYYLNLTKDIFRKCINKIGGKNE